MNTHKPRQNACSSNAEHDFTKKLFNDCVYYEQTQNGSPMQNQLMKYKGYYAHIFPCEGNELVGEVIGIENMRFYARSVSDLLVAFEETIDNYLISNI